MDGFEEKMKVYKDIGENLYPSMDAVNNVKSLENGRQKTRVGKRIMYFNSLVATLIIVLLPICGYAAYKYPAIFTQFFGQDDTQMMEEMITEETQMVENEEYRLAVENTLVDANTRILLVSVQALNEESWQALCENNFAPGISTSFAGDIMQWPQEDMTNEKEWKKYWTFEFTARATVKLDLFFLPAGEDYLCMQVSVEGIEIENTTVKISPDDLKLCDGIKIDEIYIDRLGIELVGTSEAGVLPGQSDPDFPSFVAIRKKLGIVDPEVIVEMEDGTKVCVLIDENRTVSTDVDEKMEITLLSYNNGLIYHSSSSSGAVVTGVEYKFTEVLDTEKIVKVWVDGVEHEIE